MNEKVLCPKCKKEKLNFNFAGNNGYVAMCGTCQELLYYCAIFGKTTQFKPTGKSYEIHWQDVYNSQEKEVLA